MLKLTLLCFPALLYAQLPAQPRTSSYTVGPSIQPLIIIGEGWSQQLTIINVSYYQGGEPTVGTVRFYTQGGKPWSIPLKGIGSVDHVDVNLASGQMMVLDTEVSFGAQQLGWALFDLSSNVNQWGIYHAFTVFRKQTAGAPDLMTSVPFVDALEDEWIIPFDNRDGQYPGIGIVSTRSSPTQYTLDVYDTNGALKKTITKTVNPSSLLWFSLVGENPDLAGFAGQIKMRGGLFSSAVFTLRFAGNGAFTGVPLVHTFGR